MRTIELTEITLRMLVNAGLIRPGTKIFTDSKPVREAIINDKGEIEIVQNGQTLLFSYPSGAARVITNLNVNGWIFWKIKDGDNFVNLSAFREKYLLSDQRFLY